MNRQDYQFKGPGASHKTRLRASLVERLNLDDDERLGSLYQGIDDATEKDLEDLACDVSNINADTWESVEKEKSEAKDPQQIVEDNVELVVTDAQGIYVPLVFMRRYAGELIGVDLSDIESVLEGPDHEYYWEAWDSVLRNGKIGRMSIIQEGAVYLVNHEGFEADCVTSHLEACEVWEQWLC